MSDTPQGPGWWQASDGKFYPPEARAAGSAAGVVSDEQKKKGGCLKYGLIGLGALVVLGIIGAALGSPSDDDEPTNVDASS